MSRVVFVGVDPGGQAERLGLKADDAVLTYGGKEVKGREEFVKGRAGEPAGGKLQELVVLRGGKRLTFTVLPGPLGVQLTNRMVPAGEGETAPAGPG